MTVEEELITRMMPKIKEDEIYLLSVPNCKVLSDCFLLNYRKFVPLENLKQEEKQDLWNYIKEHFKGTKEELIRKTKIVYCITKYL